MTLNNDAAAVKAANEAQRAGRHRILLVGCGKTKRDTSAGPVAARDLYTGNLFLARRAYAESTGRPWWILSAEHGLLEAEAQVIAYDTRIIDLTPMEKRRWAAESMQAIFARVGLLAKDVVIELHAGRAYRDALRSIYEPGQPPEVELPLEHLGIGQQLSWYIRHTPTHSDALPAMMIGSPECTHQAHRMPPVPPAAVEHVMGVLRAFREEDCGGVLGADGNVYSDADPGL